MRLILILIHVLVCLALILIILFQRGKGADMGAAFGGSSQAVFGSTGATSFLHKMTVAAAVVFMLTSLILNRPSRKRPNCLRVLPLLVALRRSSAFPNSAEVVESGRHAILRG
ncbi:MAG: preprotein translocase subunit SecG [Deltaproteobacteria bacterium]|nr:preprotein translocase subunit SecG [Deltaproteobacteria bacterium]